LKRGGHGPQLNVVPVFFIERSIKIKRVVMCGEMGNDVIKMQIP